MSQPSFFALARSCSVAQRLFAAMDADNRHDDGCADGPRSTFDVRGGCRVRFRVANQNVMDGQRNAHQRSYLCAFDHRFWAGLTLRGGAVLNSVVKDAPWSLWRLVVVLGSGSRSLAGASHPPPVVHRRGREVGFRGAPAPRRGGFVGASWRPDQRARGRCLFARMHRLDGLLLLNSNHRRLGLWRFCRRSGRPPTHAPQGDICKRAQPTEMERESAAIFDVPSVVHAVNHRRQEAR